MSLESTTKSIASAVCPLYPRSCLNLDSSPFPQSRRTFNSTLNYPPSRFLQRPAILPFSSGTFTHNTASVPIIVACFKADLINDNPDLVDAVVSGMGGMGMGGAHRRDHANSAHNLLMVRA